MSPLSLHLKATAYTVLLAHLLQGEDEQAAFGFARVEHSLHLEALELLQPRSYRFQSGHHIELNQEVLARVIKQAWDSNTALVEFHSHPLQAGWRGKQRVQASFSQSDMRGFQEWVPHIMWRLRQRPYVAVVVTPDSFDALVWRAGDQVISPRGLHSLVLDDGRELRPTGETLRLLSAGSFDYD